MDEKITLAEIKEIIDLVRSEDKIEMFRFVYGGTEISISRSAEGAALLNGIGAPSVQAQPQPAKPAVQAAPAAPAPSPEAPVPQAQDAPTARALAPGDVEIKAPSVGTFYRRPKPGADPFVEEGANVGEGDTLCIVEVMKLMNSVKSDVAGVIKQILVEDGQAVEFGQPLLIISKAGG